MTGPLPLVSVRNLRKHFPIRSGLLQRVTGAVKAVDDVSFDVASGETLALVGNPGVARPPRVAPCCD